MYRTIALVFIALSLLGDPSPVLATGLTICNPGTPLFKRVDPRGSYLAKKHSFDTIKRPTRLNLRRMGFREHDYIGLRLTGAFRAGPQFTDTIQSIASTFYNSRTFVHPGKYGQQSPVSTLAPDIPQDFSFDSDKFRLVRMPSRGTSIAFGPNDEFFSDNTDPNGDYGVCISYPNSPPKSGRSSNRRIESVALQELSDESLDAVLQRIPDGNLPDAEPVDNAWLRRNSGRGSLGIKSVPPVRSPQYRGWYDDCSGINNRACWSPGASKWNGRGKKHKGIDIFAPVDTPIRAGVRGLLTFNPAGFNSGGWGNIAVVSFRVNGDLYHLVYAHLARFEGASGRRIVNRNTVIGYVGCSGNAGTGPRCGTEMNRRGARTDHVHVSLIEKPRFTNGLRGTKRNPITRLGWSVKTP